MKVFKTRRVRVRNFEHLYFYSFERKRENYPLTMVCSRSGPMEMIVIGVSNSASRNLI